jgi:prepilin-type processing-associated H-X9-DG protein
MLMPALGKARDAAKRITCFNNLKQLMLAHTQYAGDNNGWLWLTGFSNPYDNWVLCLSGGYIYKQTKYISNMNMFCCPSSTNPRYSAAYKTYGMYWAAGDGEYTAKNYNFDPDHSNAYCNIYAIERMPSPSGFVLLSDTFSTGDGVAPIFHFTPTIRGTQPYVHLLHNGFSDCAFVDGHVAGLDPSGLRATATAIHYSLDKRYNVIYKP